MVTRLWRGWTILKNADAYEAVLRRQIFPGIQQRQIAGYQVIDLLAAPGRRGDRIWERPAHYEVPVARRTS